MLHAEQGLGDTIQFVRYVPLIARRGATVILECQAGLVELLRNIEGVARIVARGDLLPAFDLHCPLLSLPLAFATELATIPAKVPYIQPQEQRATRWRGGCRTTAGCVSGSAGPGTPDHLNDHNRSIPLERFATLLAAPSVDFVSLQRDVRDRDAPILRDRAVAQLGQEFQDFADTAAVVAMLDRVIAVDTAVAHLAGAMARATDVLVPFSPDWRWLLDRTDSPWYPTMRLFRQTAIGDWDGPLCRLRQELADASCQPGTPSPRDCVEDSYSTRLTANG